MTETKTPWTPGPWTVEPVQHQHMPRWVRTGEPMRTVAMVCGNSPAELDSNARLIAAAPDMAEAVRIAAETFERYAELHLAKGTPDGDRKAAENEELAKLMRAALPKAGGAA